MKCIGETRVADENLEERRIVATKTCLHDSNSLLCRDTSKANVNNN
jgi:hypothetical protein